VRSAKEVGRVGEVGDVSDADDGLAEGAIGALRVTMGDFAPGVPAQAAFWQPRAQRWETLAELGEMLARRYPTSERLLLTQLRPATPAVFHEERFALLVLATPAEPPHAGAVAEHPIVPVGDLESIVPEPHWW